MFSHIQALKVEADDTAVYEFSEIMVNGVCPQITVRVAAEANKPYYNELLKTQAKKATQLSRGKINPKILEENRDEDRRLFPLYVIDGFVEGTVLDENGEEVKYTPEVAGQFVRALPDDIFDRFRGWCANPDNFRSEDIDGTAKGKN